MIFEYMSCDSPMSKGPGKYPVARAIAKGEGRHVDHARHKGLRGCHKGVPQLGALSKLAEIRKGQECEASMTSSVSKC